MEQHSKDDCKNKYENVKMIRFRQNEPSLPITENRLEELQRIFREVDEVLSAYLFGSYAEGVHHQRSDMDIAVRLMTGLTAMEKHQVRMDLLDMLETVFNEELDVLILNDASLKMVHQVFFRGKAIYVKNDRQEEAFRLQKQKEFFDFQYYMEKESRDLRAFYDC